MARKWEVAEDGRPFVWETNRANASGRQRAYGTVAPCHHCSELAFSKRKRKGFCGYKCSNTSRRTRYGPESNAWKGGKFYAHHDGVRILDHNNPMSNSAGYVLQHRLVASEALGRPLRRGEVVHHIDGDNTNNKNNNLLVCTQPYHTSLHKRMETWLWITMGFILAGGDCAKDTFHLST
jgi:hypothetical protein